MPYLEMNCSNLTQWLGTRTEVPVMATRVTCPTGRWNDLGFHTKTQPVFNQFVIYLFCQIHLFPSHKCRWFITSAGILVLVWLHLNLFSFVQSIIAGNILDVNCHQLSLYNVARMIHDAGYWQNKSRAWISNYIYTKHKKRLLCNYLFIPKLQWQFN